MQHRKQTLGIIATFFLALGIMALNAWAQNPMPSANNTPRQDSGTVLKAKKGLSSLPAAAQPAVSATLGAHDARYQVRPVNGAMSAESAAQELIAKFTRKGVEVRLGRTGWGLTLRGYGYGEALQNARAAAPKVRANRVEYQRGPLIEWYVNGPVGLEQGFTFVRRPAEESPLARGASPLSIALSIPSELTAATTRDGKALTLRDSHGKLVLRYTGLAAHDATGRELAAWLEVGRGQLRVEVNDAGARYPVTVDPFVQQAELTASNGGEYDQFGNSIAVSSDGTTIVVGARNTTVGANAYQGAAYVFVEPASGWTTATQTAELTASDGAAYEGFGWSVAISGNGSTIAVGGPLDNIGSNLSQGAAYVFVEPASGWTTATQTAELTASDGAANDSFGWSVEISGNGSTVVASAPYHTVGSNVNQGAAYVFAEPSSGWASTSAFTAKLTASDGAANDSLGSSVAISGNGSTIVAGAPEAAVDPDLEQGAGYVLVFAEPSSGWASTSAFTAKLTASDGALGDFLGDSVSISGDGSTIVAGAPDATIGSNTYQGAVYVFAEPSSGWTGTNETAKLTASDGATYDFLGDSVSISGDGSTIAAGADQATVGSNVQQGAAYMFVKPSNGWATATQTTELTATGADNFFGSASGLSNNGSTIAIGALYTTVGSNAYTGAAYVFLGVSSASLSPTSLSFGSQQVGASSSAQSVTLTNSGNAPLHVTSVATSNSSFSTTTNCVTASPLAAGASCTESVTFTPASAGAISGSLTFTDDSGGVANSTQAVSLSGTGTAPVATASPASLSFASQAIGSTSAAQTVTLSNTGSAPLSISTFMITGSFSIRSNTCGTSLAAATSCQIGIAFTPQSVGALTGMLTITDNSNGVSNSTQTVTLSGTGLAGFTITPTPSTETITRGILGAFILTLKSVDGFKGKVTLSCSGGPAGSYCADLPQTVNLNGTALAISGILFPKTAAAGTYTITFTGTSGVITEEATATFIVK